VSTTSKFEGDVADRWSDETYANITRYLRHRAELLSSVGPALAPGDRVLDLGCGDGRLGEFLVPYGLTYVGVDGSSSMVAAARRRLGKAAEIVHADLNDYEPAAPVQATALFGALYYVRDRGEFFERAAAFTEKKLVFNLSPRRYRLDEVGSELRAAGLDRLDLRPFFVPQTVRLPDPLLGLLVAAERSGFLARALLRVRFSYVCAAFRSGARTISESRVASSSRTLRAATDLAGRVARHPRRTTRDPGKRFPRGLSKGLPRA
jgi:SAM-dependent methyltransferase